MPNRTIKQVKETKKEPAHHENLCKNRATLQYKPIASNQLDYIQWKNHEEGETMNEK